MNILSLNEEMAEFCGVIMGDGNIWSNGRKYEVTITGNIINDKEYFDTLYTFIETSIKKKPYYRIRGRGLRISIYSKEFHNFITQHIGIPEREAKSDSGIPSSIMSNKAFLRRFIRGVFDTDGTVFISNKPGSPNYPSLEISNSNVSLIRDIYDSLNSMNFRVHKRLASRGEYKVSIYGKRMIKKWGCVIGSSNPNKRRRIESILELFY